MLALIELLAVVDESLPTVVGGRERFAECGNDILESECLHHAFEDAVISLGIGLSALNVGLRLEAKTELRIFLVANAYVNILHERLHDALSLLRSPELLAEVQVDRHCHSVTLGSLASQTCELCCLVADGRCDTAPVEPVGTFHNLVEIKVAGVGLGDRAARTVVNHL